MGTLYVFVIIVTLSTHCSAYVVSHSETDRSKASVILKEGQSAEILCMTKGTGDYFWRKGATLYNSTIVASFTVGEVSDDFQPYSVTENGTLHIRSVTLKDEGNYFCRLSSTENECYGEVKILVQASLRNFDLAIDRCDGESSCLLYLYPSQLTSLTCTAINAPPLMTLKWFNGSKEITEGIEQNEILPPNGNSREITSTVAAVYGHPAFLTCQAVDPKRSNDDVRFAHAHVEMTVPVHEALAIWIIVAGTLAGCFIIFVIFSLIQARAKGKKYKKKYEIEKEENLGLLEVKMSMQEEQNEEISRLKKEQNEEISRLKTKTAKDEVKITYAEESAKTKEREIANTDQELTDLKTKLQQRDEEIKKAKNENLELQKKIANIEATLTATKEIAKTKGQEIANKDQELTDLKSKLPDQIQEMHTLKGDLESKAKSIAELENKLRQKEEEINKERNANIELQTSTAVCIGRTTVAGELAERRNKEISELKKKVEQKEQEINNQREKYSDCQTNLQKKEVALQGKSDEISDLKTNLQKKEIALKAKIVEISDLKSKLKEKDSELGKISTERTNLKTNLQKKEIALQGKSDEISDLKSKLKEKDSELVEISKELTNLKEEFAKKERAKEQKSSERSSNNKQGQN